MKRYLVLLLLALPLAASAETFEAGRDYQELPVPPAAERSSQIEVREFFWYGCPHCFDLEPALKAWLNTKPANAVFVRTPAMSGRWLVHAQMYYTLEMLGVLDKLHQTLFRAIHVDRGMDLLEPSGLADFAVAHGIERRRFLDAWDSFGVRMKLEQAQRLNDDLKISSVPALVVDGKYITSPGSAGGSERALQVVDFLIARAAAERKRASRH